MTKWGCKDLGYQMVVTVNNRLVAPDFINDKSNVQQNPENNKFFYVAGDKEANSNSFSLNVNGITLRQMDNIQLYYREALYQDAAQDNEGNVCFNFKITYDADVKPDNYKQIILNNNVCVNAADDKAPGNRFTVTYELKNINKLILVANKKDNPQGLTCNYSDKKYNSYFGCGTYGYSIIIDVISNGKTSTVAPNFDFDISLKETINSINGKPVTWSIAGIQDSDNFEYKTNFFKLNNGDQIHAIYSEVKYQSTLQDNAGQTCFTLIAEYNGIPPSVQPTAPIQLESSKAQTEKPPAQQDNHAIAPMTLKQAVNPAQTLFPVQQISPSTVSTPFNPTSPPLTPSIAPIQSVIPISVTPPIQPITPFNVITSPLTPMSPVAPVNPSQSEISAMPLKLVGNCLYSKRRMKKIKHNKQQKEYYQ